MGCIEVRKSDLFNVYLESDNGKDILQIGVSIREIDLWDTLEHLVEL